MKNFDLKGYLAENNLLKEDGEFQRKYQSVQGTIKELAEIIKEVVDFKGKINYDLTKPDGSPRKFLDSKRINNLGFKPEISLKEGLIKTYQDFIKS